MGDFLNVEWVNRARHTKIHGHVIMPVRVTREIETDDGRTLREETGEVRHERYAVGTPAKLVLYLLAMHAHEDGTHAYPSAATLAEESEIDEREVRRQLDRLEAAGWITSHGISEFGTVMYRLNLDPVPKQQTKRQRRKGDTGNRVGESPNPPAGEIPNLPAGESPNQINKGTNKRISCPPPAAFASLDPFGLDRFRGMMCYIGRVCGRTLSQETEHQSADLKRATEDILRLGGTTDDVTDWLNRLSDDDDKTFQPEDVVRGVEERLRARQAPIAEQPGWKMQAAELEAQDKAALEEAPRVIVDSDPQPEPIPAQPKMKFWKDNGYAEPDAWEAVGAKDWGDFLKSAEEHGQPYRPPRQRTRAELLRA